MVGNFRRHFRWNRQLKHPVYVLDENDDYYFFIILTHAPFTAKRRNIALQNGQYFRPMVCVCDKDILPYRLMRNKFEKADGPILREFYKLHNVHRIIR